MLEKMLMPHLRIVIALVIAVTLSASTFAQRGNNAWKRYRHDFSVGYGFNTFLANLGENDKLGVAYMAQRSTFNFSYRYFVAKHFALRSSLTHAVSRKNDKIHSEPLANTLRLDYECTLTELGIMGEYHIFDETTLVKRRGRVRRARGGIARRVNFSPSFFAGVAVDYWRPFAEYQGSKMILRPYSDDAGFAPPDEYNRWNLHFPVGTTVRFVMSENWRFGFEFGYRIGIRDYIGQVSSVYYYEENPTPQYQDHYTDPTFTGNYATFAEGDGNVTNFADERGRSSYFFGTINLTFRLKS